MTMIIGCRATYVPFAASYRDAAGDLAVALKAWLDDEWAKDPVGLYWCSLDSGAEAAMELWKNAVDQGPGLASPRPFPWALSSSPAGFLSIELGIRGPVHVRIGDDRDFTALTELADADLRAGTVRAALLIHAAFTGEKTGAHVLFRSPTMT